MERQYEISIIRLLSTASIVLCHIYQYRGNYLGSFFNIGVQIFFFMSGYLLSEGEKDSYWVFRRFFRIFVDYAIYLCILEILLFVFNGPYYSGYSFIEILTLIRYAEKLEHFWFLKAIIICYLLVLIVDYPIIQLIGKKLYIQIIASGVLCFFIYYFYKGIYMYPDDILLFLLGYIIRKLFDQKIIHVIVIIITGGAFAYCLFNRIILWEDCGPFALRGYSFFGGIFIFEILQNILKMTKISFDRFSKLLRFSDKYSYDIYITHSYLIFGEISIMNATKSSKFNDILLVICVLISAYILYLISQFVICKIEPYIRN